MASRWPETETIVVQWAEDLTHRVRGPSKCQSELRLLANHHGNDHYAGGHSVCDYDGDSDSELFMFARTNLLLLRILKGVVAA